MINLSLTLFKKLKNDLKVFVQKYGLMLPEQHTMGFMGSLKVKVFPEGGGICDYGIVSRKKVTDVFANYLVDAMQTTGMMNLFRWHESGFSTAAESAADTTLTAATTETRDLGTSTEGATANIYRSIATHTYQNASTVGEHGLFASSAAGTLLDRSMFAGIAVSSGDQIQFTYELTVVSSG